MPERSIAHLLANHREIEQTFTDLRALLESVAAAPAWIEDHSTEFARLARRFDQSVRVHMQKEEEILYPALEDFLPRDSGPLAVLRGEHRDLSARLGEWRAAGERLAQGNAPPEVREAFLRGGREVIRIEQNHFYKEERVLFPMAARFLSAERDALLLLQMEGASLAEALKSAAEPPR